MQNLLSRFQNIAIVGQILQEEFDTQEEAITKYGKSILIVRDLGREYQLELKQHCKHDWNAARYGCKEVPIKQFYRYVRT
jgi:hypothetical protein